MMLSRKLQSKKGLAQIEPLSAGEHEEKTKFIYEGFFQTHRREMRNRDD